jgi:hypothetical protein
VHNHRVTLPLRFPAGNFFRQRQNSGKRGSTLLLSASKSELQPTCQPKFLSQPALANQGNQDSRERISREDHYTPENFRMECVGKTCCAAYRIPVACRKLVAELRILELAIGFEPTTL